MIAFDLNSTYELKIHIEKIEPFSNICIVNDLKEEINVEMEYIPHNKVLDIVSYREYFKNKVYNDLLENVLNEIFESLNDLLSPKYLKVTLYLEDNRLTPWSITIENKFKVWGEIYHEMENPNEKFKNKTNIGKNNKQ